MRTLVAAVAGALALVAALPATAQDYPVRPITMIVTWDAGGTTDIVARLTAPELGAALGQAVAVVNRPGGGGALGTTEVLDAPADGHTLLMTTSGNHVLTPLARDVGYTPEDFIGIGQLSSRSLVLAVHSESPWHSLADLQEAAAADPGGLTFGAVPNGMPFLTLSNWAAEADVELVHVPQTGGAPGVNGVLGGHLDMVPESMSSVLSHIQAGSLRALAVFNEDRDPAAPDIPTAREQGFEVFGNPFTGVAVARGTPEPIVERLREVVAAIANDPGFQERMKQAGDVVTYLDGTTFEEVWRRDWEAYGPILRP